GGPCQAWAAGMAHRMGAPMPFRRLVLSLALLPAVLPSSGAADNMMPPGGSFSGWGRSDSFVPPGFGDAPAQPARPSDPGSPAAPSQVSFGSSFNAAPPAPPQQLKGLPDPPPPPGFPRLPDPPPPPGSSVAQPGGQFWGGTGQQASSNPGFQGSRPAVQQPVVGSQGGEPPSGGGNAPPFNGGGIPGWEQAQSSFAHSAFGQGGALPDPPAPAPAPGSSGTEAGGEIWGGIAQQQTVTAAPAPLPAAAGGEETDWIDHTLQSGPVSTPLPSFNPDVDEFVSGTVDAARALPEPPAPQMEVTYTVPVDVPMANCVGKETQWALCTHRPCAALNEKIDCVWDEWAEWTALGGCSGLGSRLRRIRTMNNEHGMPCSGPQEQTAQFNAPPFFEQSCLFGNRDCSWGAWNEWTFCGDCNACGKDRMAQSERWRLVEDEAIGDGHACQGTYNETRSCGAEESISCKLSVWAEWTMCSMPCGGGVKAHMRRVIQHAEYGGAACKGPLRESIECNEQPCTMSVDCDLSEWHEWHGCEGGSSQQNRERSILAHAQGNGKRCEDSLSQTVGCTKMGGVPWCEFTKWEEWGSCPVACGGGQQERTRHMTGDRDCIPLASADLKEVRGCNMDSCDSVSSCSLSDWDSWGGCSQNCGLGVSVRARAITQAASNGGSNCVAGLKEMKDCVVKECPVRDCLWAAWDEWSAAALARCIVRIYFGDNSVFIAVTGPEEKASLVISWNAAGFVRSHELIKEHYGSLDVYLQRHGAAIFCVQEAKCKPSALQNVAESRKQGAIVPGYRSFWAFNELKGVQGGFNGVATWVREDIAAVNGVRATQNVLLDPDLDREGRCLLVDLGGLAIFNVYAPYVVQTSTAEVPPAEEKTPSPKGNVKKPAAANNNRRGSAQKIAESVAKKLRFLQLLEKRVQEMRRLGKRVIICGDLNLTWRSADVKAHRLCIPVRGCFANGRQDWCLPTLSGAEASAQTLMRVCDVAKLLRTEVLVPAEEARAIVSTLAETNTGLVVSNAEGLSLSDDRHVPAGRTLLSARAANGNTHITSGKCSSDTNGRSNNEDRQDTEAINATRTLSNSNNASNSNCAAAVFRRDSTLQALKDFGEAAVTLEFGVPVADLAAAGHSTHLSAEPECMELLKSWVGPQGDFLDTFVACHGDAVDRFTFWSQQANLRYSNCGSRLDYVLCEKDAAQELVATVTAELVGGTDHVGAESAEAAQNAATNFASWHGAHNLQKDVMLDKAGGLSLQQDDMRLNNSQFRSPHTGILYTPPKYSDHVPVCACFVGRSSGFAKGSLTITEEQTRRSTPWVAQASISSFFGAGSSKRKLGSA
ncbi:unnamed protein product, partial [Polarella glacialis]